MRHDHRVVIWCPELSREQLRDRLAVCDGVVPATTIDSREAVFELDAIVPDMPWRAPTDEEADRILDQDGAPSIENTVGLVVCPRSFAQRALAIFEGCQGGSIEPEAALLLRRRLGEDIAAWLGAETRWRSDGNVIDLSIFFNRPGMRTVSFDPATREHVGLHLDSFDRLADHRRAEASNRLSINLGTEDRRFLFVPTEALGLLRQLECAAAPPTNALRLATRYLTARPRTRVWSLRLRPGEAYLAPTENLIHDGSSETMSARDVHCTLRGHFVPNGTSRRGPGEPIVVRARTRDGSLERVELKTPDDALADAPETVRIARASDGRASPWLATETFERRSRPYLHYQADGTLAENDADALAQWLEDLTGWTATDAPFYQVRETDLGALAPPPALEHLFALDAMRRLREQLGRIFGCRFLDLMRIAAHRIDTGQGAGVHSDDPDGVEETHRMVLTLGWRRPLGRGGLTGVFADRSLASLVRLVEPLHNRCVVFEASACSHHAITDVRRGPRFSVVLSFWRDPSPVQVR